MKGHAGVFIVLILLTALIVLLFPFAYNVSSTKTVSGSNSTLTVWDIADQKGGSYKVYAAGSPQGSGPNSTTTANFFANYTNLTSGQPINGSGISCNISFNETGTWNKTSMYFDASSKLYKYNRTFNSRGFYFWNVTCHGQDYDKLNAIDNMTVTNTPAGIYVPLLSMNCSEDTACKYNFSQKCYDIDDIDEGNLIYGYKAGTEFPGFSMNSTNGNVTVYITNDGGCGVFLVTLLDKDVVGEGATADKEFIVNAVNDIPVLTGVPSSSYQNSSLYSDINANDEESSTFYFNLTYVSCYRPFNEQHSNVTNCSGLFSIDHQTGVINRTNVFENYEVGNYTINFTATDPGVNHTGTSIPPYKWLTNATGYQLVYFNVVDVNDRPVIIPVPNQFWTQNQNVKLVVNASDIDNGTLVFSTTTLYRNLSVFYHNASLFPVTYNQTVYLNNGTSLGNATLNYTPVAPNQVGNYTVNISVYDGRTNGKDWVLFNITVKNINDPPNISFNCRNYSVEGLEYVCNVGENTTDPDKFPSYIPYADPVNGTLTFYLNFTNCSKINVSDTNCSIFGINQATGVINYSNPLRKDAGNYTLNISVTDGGNLTDWTEFNLTVIADYQPNITTSVPPQTATQNQSFYLYVNATDLDNATADNLTFRTETYYNSVLLNNTLFPIWTDTTFWVSDNTTMGVMNYISVNNSQVGNYTVRIIVNDTWGREDFILVNFTVWNLNDPPVLNFSCSNSTNEDLGYFCNVGENTTDIDMQTPYSDNLTYTLTIISGFDFFGINSTTGVLNFTPSNDSWTNNTYNLTYVLNISVIDSSNALDWEVFNLTIHAINDPPVFNFSNTTAWENFTFVMDLDSKTTDEEGDTPFYYSLTFLSNCSKINVSDTNCSIFGINQATGVINFTPVNKDIGNYTINVTVRDSGNTTNPHNATGWKLVYFIIKQLNVPPNLDVWFTNPGNRSIVENDTITFFITVSDPNGDSLTCRWYKDGYLNRTINNCHASGGQAGSFTYKSSFEDSGLSNGTHNFTLRISDALYTTLMWWSVNVTNKNRPPRLIHNIATPQVWPMETSHNIYPNLTYYMMDPDNQNSVTDDDTNLFYSYYPSVDPISVSINQNTTTATLTPAPDWYGIRYIVFTLNDSVFQIQSNNVTLNVTYVETETQTIVQQISTGTATTVTRIASLTITVISPVKIRSNARTVVPVDFKNTGDVTLGDISILAEASDKDDFSLSFDIESIKALEVGRNQTTHMTIDSRDLTKERYEIKIIGKVGNPRFNQSTIIYLENIFENRTKLEERIELVKDLFEENPECLDLTELIVEAERELGKGDLGKARELTETALQNCRDLIRYQANMTQPIVPFRERVPVTELMIAFIIIGLFTIGAYYVINRRAERKARRKRERETVIIRT